MASSRTVVVDPVAALLAALGGVEAGVGAPVGGAMPPGRMRVMYAAHTRIYLDWVFVWVSAVWVSAAPGPRRHRGL